MSANRATAARTTKLTRREQKAATRRAIRAAARQCFSELGYDRTGIADIARAAGVAHGTFYVHYENKAVLLDEILAEINSSFVARLAPVYESADRTVAGLVRATAEVFLDTWEEYRDFVECYAQRSATGLDQQSLRDGFNPPMAALLRHTFSTTAAERGVTGRNWELVTQALLGMWLRVGLQYVFNDRVTRADALDTLVALSAGAIAGVLPETIDDPQEPEE